MAQGFIANCKVPTSSRTKIMDIAVPYPSNLSTICLSASSKNPVWEIYFDSDVSGSLGTAPTPSLATVTTGGSLPRSTKYYVRVSAQDAGGFRSPASDTLVTITTGATTDTNKINLTLTAVAGASSYNIYLGKEPGQEYYHSNVTSLTPSIVDDFTQIGVVPMDPTIQISSSAGKMDVIPISPGTISVATRVAVFVTFDGTNGVAYASILGS